MLDNRKPKFKVGDSVGRTDDLSQERQVVDICEGEYKILYCSTGTTILFPKGWVEENFVLFERREYLFKENM